MPISKIKTSSILADAASTNLNIDAGTLFLDTTNNFVGVGTTSPTTKVQITRNALSGFVSRTNAALTLEDTAGTELYLASSNTGYGQLRFGDNDNNFRGAITYDHSDDSMYFFTGASIKLRIESSGNVGIGTTAPATEAAAARLALVGTALQNASSLATSNTKAVLSLRADSSSGYSLAFGTVVTTNNQYIQAVNFNGGAASSELLIQPYGGNVGIGTASPNIQQWRAGTYLTVSGDTAGGQLQLNSTRTDGTSLSVGSIQFNYSTNTTSHKLLAVIEASTEGTTVNQRGGGLLFFTKTDATAVPSERMRIDSVGNVGIGATPSAWALSGQKVLQVLNASLSGYTTDEATVAGNAYHNGSGWRYIATNFAEQYAMSGGGHQWYTAPSGTAGNAITFTERMRITSAGNVGIGTTSVGSMLTVAGSVSFASGQFTSDTSGSLFTQGNTLSTSVPNGAVGINTGPAGGTGLTLTNKAGNTAWETLAITGIASQTSIVYVVDSSGNPLLRVLGSGNVGIGTASPASKLNVAGTFTITGAGMQLDNGQGIGAKNASGTYRQIAVMDGSNNLVLGGTVDSGIIFQTSGGNVRGTFDSNGNLLIGTVNSNVLDAVGGHRPLIVSRSDTNTSNIGSLAAIAIHNSDTTTNNVSQLNFTASSGASTNLFSSGIISVIHGARTNGQYHTGQMCFSTSPSLNAAPTEKMRLTNDGKLTIGTTNATASVHLYNSSSAGFRMTGGIADSDIWQRQVVSIVNLFTYTTICTITPSTSGNSWYRGFVKATLSGHQSGGGNAAVIDAIWYLDSNGGSQSTTAQVSAGTVSGLTPGFRVVVSGTAWQIQVQSPNTANRYDGAAMLEIMLSHGAGTTPSFTIA